MVFVAFLLSFSWLTAACTSAPPPSRPNFSKPASASAEPSSSESEDFEEEETEEEEPEIVEPEDLNLTLSGLPTEASEADTLPISLTWEKPVEAYSYLIDAACESADSSKFKLGETGNTLTLDITELPSGRHKVCVIGKTEGQWEMPKQAHIVEFERKEFLREVPIKLSAQKIHCASNTSRDMEFKATLVLKRKEALIRWKPMASAQFRSACKMAMSEFESPLLSYVMTEEGITGIWRQNSIDSRWIAAKWTDTNKSAVKEGLVGMGTPGSNPVGKFEADAIVPPTTPIPPVNPEMPSTPGTPMTPMNPGTSE